MASSGAFDIAYANAGPSLAGTWDADWANLAKSLDKDVVGIVNAMTLRQKIGQVGFQVSADLEESLYDFYVPGT